MNSNTKKLLSLSFWLLSLASATAKADFIPMPIQCKMIDNNPENQEVIHVFIKEHEGQISGRLIDGFHKAHVTCLRVSDPKNSSRNRLSCRGEWVHDKSEATFEATLFTYVPMGSIKRSHAMAEGATMQGICIAE